ncbi:diguanylate cyclase [bacterium]
MRDQYILSLFFTSVVFFILVIFVYLKSTKNKAVIPFMLFYIFAGIWSFGEGMLIIAPNESKAIFWNIFCNIGIFWLATFNLHFIFSLLNINDKRKIILYIAYIYSIIASILIFNPKWFLPPPVPKFDLNYFIEPGPLYPHFVIVWFLIVAYGLFELFRAYRGASDQRRNQLKYLYWALFIGYIGGSGNYFLTFDREVFFINPFGTYGVAIMVTIIAYVSLEYHLMEIDLAGRRILNHVLTWATIFIPFLIGIFIFHPSWQYMTVLLGLAILITLFIQEKIQRYFEPTVLGTKYGYLLEISKLAETDTGEIHYNTSDLITHLLTGIQKIIKLNSISFFLFNKERNLFTLFKKEGGKDLTDCVINKDDPILEFFNKEKIPFVKDDGHKYDKEKREKIKKFMDESGFEVGFPFFVSGILMGILFLGNKTNKNIFNPKEILGIYNIIKQVEYKLTFTLMIEDQHAISEIGSCIGETNTLEELAAYITRTFMRFLNVLYISVYFFDPKEKKYTCYYKEGSDVNKKVKDIIIDESSYLINFLSQRREPIFLHEIEKLANQSRLQEFKTSADLLKQMRAKLVIPIISGKFLGFINISEKRTANIFNMQDFTNASLLASHVSMAASKIVINDMALRDELTGLHNLRYFNQKSVDMINKGISEEKIVLCVNLDMDNLREVNNNLGHKQGNKIIKASADYLSKSIRKTDILARMGGDEFAIMKLVENFDEAKYFVQRLWKNAVNEKNLIGVTYSIGSSILIQDVEDAHLSEYDPVLIRHLMMMKADDGSYEAKEKGRNRICFGGEIHMTEVIGQGGYKLKSLIFTDSDLAAEDQECIRYFNATDSIISRANNYEQGYKFINEQHPNIIFISALNRDINEVKDLAYKITSHHVTMSVGVLLNSLDENLRKELEEAGVEKIFVGQIKLSDIEAWIREVNETIFG